PNSPMRSLAEQNLGSNPRFRSIAATAEQTTLPDSSVDFVVAGQAFHWFDRSRARLEFARILRPDGWTVLICNERTADSSRFAAAFEEVLKRHSVDYTAMDPKKVSRDSQAISDFLGPRMQTTKILHHSRLTWEALTGLVASASYAPLSGHPKYEGMIK